MKRIRAVSAVILAIVIIMGAAAYSFHLTTEEHSCEFGFCDVCAKFESSKLLMQIAIAFVVFFTVMCRTNRKTDVACREIIFQSFIPVCLHDKITA